MKNYCSLLMHNECEDIKNYERSEMLCVLLFTDVFGMHCILGNIGQLF